ncbi:hypothetical protein SK128_022976 [Halocaridina rubra]|uniref:CHK kinase-like domain-containing protein n=1 Tax=Halocaridina rubra TaxID=373956 RepID=A0AAN8XG97_HALRR
MITTHLRKLNRCDTRLKPKIAGDQLSKVDSTYSLQQIKEGVSTDETSKDTSHHSRILDDHVRATLKADIGIEAELTSWTIEDFTQRGDNFMTCVSSVKISYILQGGNETKSYIVKVYSDKIPENLQPLAGALFIKESKFYSFVAPALNKELEALGQESLRFPKLHFHSLENRHEVMYMEDLRVRGFKMFDRKKGMDIAHVHLVIKELARLHAASMILQQKHMSEDLAEKFEFLKIDWDNYSEKAEENFTMCFAHAMKNCEEMLNKIGGYETSEKWLRKHKASPVDIFRKGVIRKEPFDLICHGDCWNNNMLFRYNDEGIPVEVMLVDLQLSKKASPATDLTYLMYTSLTGDVRTTYVESFLSMYYDTFTMIMQAAAKPVPFTLQHLQQEYNSKREYGCLFGVLLVHVIVRSPEDFPDRNSDLGEENWEKIKEKWRQNSLNILEKNPLFKPRLLALFDDMVANGIIA